MIEMLTIATVTAFVGVGCLMFLLFALDSRLRAVEMVVFPDSADATDTETEIPDEPVSDQFPVYEKIPIVNHSGSSK